MCPISIELQWITFYTNPPTENQNLPAGQVPGSVLSIPFPPGCQQEVSFLKFSIGSLTLAFAFAYAMGEK